MIKGPCFLRIERRGFKSSKSYLTGKRRNYTQGNEQRSENMGKNYESTVWACVIREILDPIIRPSNACHLA